MSKARKRVSANANGQSAFERVHMNRLSEYLYRRPLSALTVLTLGMLQATAVAAQTPPAAPTGAGSTAAASYTDLGYGQYPRVTEVEQQLLGKSYEKEPLNTRVTRLETKQFGKPSPNDDLADRLDRLDALIKHKPAVADEEQPANGTYSAPIGGAGTAEVPQMAAVGGSGPGVGGQSAAGQSDGQASGTQYSASDYGSYPRVTELEQQLLGSTYVKDPLPVRVARLETKEFGKSTPDDDLCDRIDKLDKIANPHKNSRVADNSSPDGTAQDGSQNGGRGGNGGSGGKGGAIGKALLGMLGGNMFGNMMGGVGNGMSLNQMMPGLQDDMRKDAAAERQQKQQGGAPARASVATTSPFAPGALPVIGAENRIAIIEKFVLGKDHSELPLAERVEHVEKKLVPYEHHQAGQDLSIRVDHLWSILAAANKPSTNKSVAASQGPTQ